MPTKINLHVIATSDALERHRCAGSDACGRLILTGDGSARGSACNKHYRTKA
jgi:hypothetical protein